MNRKTTYWNIDISTILNTRMFSLLYRSWWAIVLQHILFLLENILYNANKYSLSSLHFVPYRIVPGSFISYALAFELRLNKGILCVGCFVWIIEILVFETESRHISHMVCVQICGDGLSTSDLRDDLHLGQIMVAQLISVNCTDYIAKVLAPATPNITKEAIVKIDWVMDKNCSMYVLLNFLILWWIISRVYSRTNIYS